MPRLAHPRAELGWAEAGTLRRQWRTRSPSRCCPAGRSTRSSLTDAERTELGETVASLDDLEVVVRAAAQG